jgi:hypothetical protein
VEVQRLAARADGDMEQALREFADARREEAQKR